MELKLGLKVKTVQEIEGEITQLDGEFVHIRGPAAGICHSYDVTYIVPVVSILDPTPAPKEEPELVPEIVPETVIEEKNAAQVTAEDVERVNRLVKEWKDEKKK